MADAENKPAEAPPAEAPPAEAPPAEAPPAEAPPAEAAPPPAEAPPAEAPPAEAPPAAAPPAEAPPAEAPPAEPAPPAAPAPAAAGVELASSVEESWESDGATFQKYKVVVSNKTDAVVKDIELEIANIAAFDQGWNSTVVRIGDGKPALLSLPDYLVQAGGLAAGASHELGFIVKKAEAGEPAITVKAK